MRWLTIAASFALACAPVARAAKSSSGGQSGTSASTSPSTQPKRPSHKHKHYSKHQPGQKAPSADRVSEIQSALAREGYLHGDPNGKLDANTVAALEKFQSANGLDANGKLDAPTLQKLGLGSDIAGVAAPKPVVPSCCSMAPSGSTSPGDKPASPCCSTSPAQPTQPAPSTQSADPANSAANGAASGATSSETKPAQK
jgi:hypothetical protein